jgi:hypothetical protein
MSFADASNTKRTECVYFKYAITLRPFLIKSLLSITEPADHTRDGGMTAAHYHTLTVKTNFKISS